MQFFAITRPKFDAERIDVLFWYSCRENLTFEGFQECKKLTEFTYTIFKVFPIFF